MSIDLSDLVESLEREVNAPGIDQLPDATTAQYLGNLQDAFWECVLDGVIEGYTESDGIVSPSSGTTDLSRELQQLVVFYAGFRIVRNQLRDLKTSFKASSGPVSYETEQAATVLKAILDDLAKKRNYLIDKLSDLGVITGTYFDAVQGRSTAIELGETWWYK